MQDRPTAGELVKSVREFLEEEILPNLEDSRDEFRTRVAMNALSGSLRRKSFFFRPSTSVSSAC